MALSHFITPLAPTRETLTVRFGATADAAGNIDDKEMGKFCKYAGESRYDLCAAGDEIEGIVATVEPRTQNGWSIAGIYRHDIHWAIADGLQATPGTGTVTAGGYVVCGTVTAKGTALSRTTLASAYAKVTLATSQANAKATPYAWRVLSLGPVGTGAVGTLIAIGRVASF